MNSKNIQEYVSKKIINYAFELDRKLMKIGQIYANPEKYFSEYYKKKIKTENICGICGNTVKPFSFKMDDITTGFHGIEKTEDGQIILSNLVIQEPLSYKPKNIEINLDFCCPGIFEGDILNCYICESCFFSHEKDIRKNITYDERNIIDNRDGKLFVSPCTFSYRTRWYD